VTRVVSPESSRNFLWLFNSTGVCYCGTDCDRRQRGRNVRFDDVILVGVVVVIVIVVVVVVVAVVYAAGPV